MATAPVGWYRQLAGVSAVALCIRVTYVLVSKRHAVPAGDAFYFHLQADLLVTGKGWFIDPWAWSLHHAVVQSAYHPPLWTLVLALPAALGAQSFLSQLLWSCVVGSAAVAVTGLAARHAAGPRAGLLAAAIAAVYPNYWLNDGSGLSETLVLLLVAAVVLVSYQLWRSPSLTRGALLGALCALAALTRAELALLVPLVLVPVCLVARHADLRRRVALAATGITVALLTVAPWIGFNLSRFDHVELISSEFGTGLASANCNSTYYGPFIGYWSFACQSRRDCGVVPVQADESEADVRCRSIGWAYIRHQSSQLPVVTLARVGREFGFFAPIQQLNLDGGFPRLMSFEQRPFDWAVVGLGMYYCLLAAAVGGVVLLRRRGATVLPLVGVLVNVVVAAMLLYGSTRFRTPFEVVLAILGGVALERGLKLVRRGRRQPDPTSV
ncbi:MAG: glycosyltransferase family 39 protein [Acidimicrobiales bacterium]|jgi:4-amino-4-deoxy-L-arabinose transferase-like glycosyltransferase